MIFAVNSKTYKIDKSLLEKVAQAAFSVLGDREGEISLVFVSERTIAEMNQRYRQKEGPTDVLSFILGTDPLIGQILICYTKAVSQSAEYGTSLEDETVRLTIHGICHIYGYDHENDADEREMKKVENKIWEKVK